MLRTVSTNGNRNNKFKISVKHDRHSKGTSAAIPCDTKAGCALRVFDKDIHESGRDRSGQLHGKWQHGRCLRKYRTAVIGMELDETYYLTAVQRIMDAEGK